MSTLHEQLSRLMDDDLSAQEKEKLIERMIDDPQAQAIWERYQLMRNALNNKLNPGEDLASRVRDAIAKEPTYNQAEIKNE